MEWFSWEGTLKSILFHASGMSKDTFHLTSLLQVLPNLTLNISGMRHQLPNFSIITY